MKNYISKNWKKIFLIIGAIFLVIDLFFIITIPATIPEDFLQYGPNVESDIFDGVDNISDLDTADKEQELVNNVTQNTGMSPDLARNLLVFGFVFIVLLVLGSIIDKEGGSDKKK